MNLRQPFEQSLSPNIQVFELLVSSGRRILANSSKIKTDYEILRACFKTKSQDDLWKNEYQTFSLNDFHSRVANSGIPDNTYAHYLDLDIKLNKGKNLLYVPHGYSKKPDGTVEVVKDILIVPFIFNSFIESKSFAKVQKEIAKFGYDFKADKVSRILRNRVYSHQGFKDHSQVGPFEPVIPKEQFDLVQKIIADKFHKRRSDLSIKSFFPLSGMIRDMQTGKAFIGYIIRKSTSIHYYYKTNSSENPCNVLADTLHRQFHSFISLLPQPLVFQECHRLLDPLLPRLINALDNEEYIKSVQCFIDPKYFADFGTSLIENWPDAWAESGYLSKRSLVKLFFPDGLNYNKDTGDFCPLNDSSVGVIF